MELGSKVACRTCGNQVDAAASLCGNCGTRLGGGVLGRSRSPATASAIPPKAIGLLMLAAVVGGLFLFLRGPIADAWQNVRDEINSATDSFDSQTGPPVPGSDGRDAPATTKGYRSVRDLARDLNKGGMKCGDVNVDAEDDSISTGSCQSGGAHVQINIYLFPPSLASAREIFFGKRTFTFVHKDNWFVITQTPQARQVQKILGGKFVRAAP